MTTVDESPLTTSKVFSEALANPCRCLTHPIKLQLHEAGNAAPAHISEWPAPHLFCYHLMREGIRLQSTGVHVGGCRDRCPCKMLYVGGS